LIYEFYKKYLTGMIDEICDDYSKQINLEIDEKAKNKLKIVVYIY